MTATDTMLQHRYGTIFPGTKADRFGAKERMQITDPIDLGDLLLDVDNEAILVAATATHDPDEVPLSQRQLDELGYQRMTRSDRQGLLSLVTGAAAFPAYALGAPATVWVQLLGVSGMFLVMGVLNRAFSRGGESYDPGELTTALEQMGVEGAQEYSKFAFGMWKASKARRTRVAERLISRLIDEDREKKRERMLAKLRILVAVDLIETMKHHDEESDDFGALIPAAQRDSVGLWASTIPAPFDDVEDDGDDEFGAEWAYDELYGAEADSAAGDGIGIAKDLTEAFEGAQGKVLTYRPELAVTAKNAAEISQVTGESLEKAVKALETTGEILGYVGMTLSSPWSWIILGSVAGTALSIKLAKAVKKRRASKASMIRFAEANNIGDANNFISFAVRSKNMDSDSRLIMVNRLSKTLAKRRRLSDRKREDVSAKLRILAAFELLDAAEGDPEAQASLTPSRRSRTSAVV